MHKTAKKKSIFPGRRSNFVLRLGATELLNWMCLKPRLLLCKVSLTEELKLQITIKDVIPWPRGQVGDSLVGIQKDDSDPLQSDLGVHGEDVDVLLCYFQFASHQVPCNLTMRQRTAAFIYIKYFCQMQELKGGPFQEPLQGMKCLFQGLLIVNKDITTKKKLSTPPICPSNQVTDLFTSTLGALPGLPQIYTDKTELDTARYLIWTQHDLLCYSRLEMWSSWSNLHNGRSGSVWGNKQRCPRSVHSEKHRWQTLYLKKIADVKTDYKIRHKTKNRVLDGATNGSHCTAYILVCVFTNTEHSI